MRWLLCLFVCLATNVLAAGRSKAIFQVEKLNRSTFAATEPLSVGDKVHLTFTKLVQGDHFLINRCGTPCNTSKLVRQIDGAASPSDPQTFEVKEEGTYYFWIQRVLETGETGPSFIKTFSAKGVHFDAKFMTGSIVTGDLERRP